jgi:hypothetical protein
LFSVMTFTFPPAIVIHQLIQSYRNRPRQTGSQLGSV